MHGNALYYGDNLDILRRHIPGESVDLVYLDPPFNSNATYNVLFAEKDGTQSAAQIKAFGDTWAWDRAAAELFMITVAEAPRAVSDALQAFEKLLGTNDMLAYLTMMAPRLLELRRVLKPTGSIYLHCDPTASHYLKVLMDAIFGAENFRSEIVWKRQSAHNDAKQGRRVHGHIHDVILYYTKSSEWTWHQQFTPYDAKHIESAYRHVEPETGRRYSLGDITGPGGAAKGNPIYEVMGVVRYWRYSKEKMEEMIRQGRVIQTRPGAVPLQKRYLDEMPGIVLQDLWMDVSPIGAAAAERLGYPTQKPEALLERIVSTSSNPGDVVLDPFCGCGTAVAAAQKLDRRWIGIDITHLAITLIKHRLRDTYGSDVSYSVTGEPTDIASAEELAATNPYQFQFWATGLVQARPAEQKKGGDRGIDGRRFFRVGPRPEDLRAIIISVKAGHTMPAHVRELRGTVEREKAAIGVLITMQEPTKEMRAEAANGGFYESPWGAHPRIQILTIRDLLGGKTIDCPDTAGTNVTFKRAPKAAARATADQTTMFDGA